MNHNIQLVGGAVIALVILNIAFNLYCGKLINKRGLFSVYGDNQIYLPIFHQSFEGDTVHKGYFTLWLGAVLFLGPALALSSTLAIIAWFGRLPEIMDIRWSITAQKSQLFLMNQAIDYWPDSDIGFVVVGLPFFIFLATLILSLRTCWLAGSALMVRPVAKTITKEEFLKLIEERDRQQT